MAAWPTTALAALVTVLVAGVSAGCEGGTGGAASSSATPTRTVDVTEQVPQFTGHLRVGLATGLQRLGIGCRQRSDRDACTVDGSATYTWLGRVQPAVVSGVRTHPDAGHGSWVVVVTFARTSRPAAQQTATRAQGLGGYALLLDAQSGDALQAVRPDAVAGGRITLRDLAKPDAWDLVDTYVTAATRR